MQMLKVIYETDLKKKENWLPCEIYHQLKLKTFNEATNSFSGFQSVKCLSKYGGNKILLQKCEAQMHNQALQRRLDKQNEKLQRSNKEINRRSSKDLYLNQLEILKIKEMVFKAQSKTKHVLKNSKFNQFENAAV